MKMKFTFLIYIILLTANYSLFSQGFNSQHLDQPILTPYGDEVIGQVDLSVIEFGNKYPTTFTYFITRDGLFYKRENGFFFLCMEEFIEILR